MVVQDLFEGDNLGLVVDNIHVLGGIAQKLGAKLPPLGLKPTEEAVCGGFFDWDEMKDLLESRDRNGPLTQMSWLPAGLR